LSNEVRTNTAAPSAAGGLLVNAKAMGRPLTSSDRDRMNPPVASLGTGGCPHQVVFWPIYHKVMVKGCADALHVRAMEEVPIHLDDIVLEMTEADENWLTVNTIAWSGVVAR